MFVSSLTWGLRKVTIPKEHKVEPFFISEIDAWILQLITFYRHIGVVPFIFLTLSKIFHRQQGLKYSEEYCNSLAPVFLLTSNQPGGWQKLNKETTARARLDGACMGKKLDIWTLTNNSLTNLWKPLNTVPKIIIKNHYKLYEQPVFKPVFCSKNQTWLGRKKMK